MAKALKDILTGVKSSKTVKPDLKDLAMSPEGNKDGLKFAAKHEIEKHEDRAGNDDHIYQGSTSKTTKYKFQKDGVYEETEEELDEKYMGFQKTKKALAAKGAKDPSALAAWIGRKKYGKQKFQAAAAKGKKLGEDAACNHTNEGTMCEVHGMKACPSDSPDMKKDKKDKKLLLDKKLKEDILNEVAPPNPKIEKWIKSNKERFVKEYGKEKGMQVLYAKAWKMHGQSESGPATNTDYVGPGAAGWTTGRLDVGNL